MVLGVAWSVLVITHYLSPAINRVASVRSVAERVESFGIPPQQLGAFYLHRNQVYGLGFYLGEAPRAWSPEIGASDISAVAARDDLRVDEMKKGARAIAWFPGQRLRLWALGP
jgi:hypothetical protein